MSLVSIIIPSRCERFLGKTVTDLLTKAEGEIEIIPILDGYWPDPPLPSDPRVRPLHFGAQQGMRNGINAAARIARGPWLMKIDGHCMLAQGYDRVLQEECEENWVMVPRRYSLEPETWTLLNPINKKPPVDYHFLSYPFARPHDIANGLHGQVWLARARERKEILIDDEMSSQGSCWFMSLKQWDRVGPLDIANYGTFAQEFQEVGMKTWLGGGEVKINKKTWYAHLHKGKTYGTGYQFTNRKWESWNADNAKAKRHTVQHWLFDRWAERKRDFKWLMERFWPVPTWPEDWEARIEAFRER